MKYLPTALLLPALWLSACANVVENPTEPATSCPMGDADADMNGYADACDQMLWADAATYTLSAADWDPKTKAVLAFYITNSFLGTDAGAAVGDEDHVTEYEVRTNAAAKRAAYWLANRQNTHVWLQPRFGEVNAEGQDHLIELRGKQLVRMVRVIDEYRLDASADVVVLRGGWQLYGY